MAMRCEVHKHNQNGKMGQASDWNLTCSFCKSREHQQTLYAQLKQPLLLNIQNLRQTHIQISDPTKLKKRKQAD